MNILVTGTAGFIGFHVAKRMVADGHTVVGIDSINEYYDINLKYARLAEAGVDKNSIEYNKPAKSSIGNYTFYQLQLEDKDALAEIIQHHKIEAVVHLAAQAGVRYSLVNPDAYINSNIVSFMSVLECCRHHNIKHLVYASSSSVYGLNDMLPFSTSHNTNHPISLYAATKKSNELMAHTYSHLFGLPVTGLRFFTAYGPWGRPDMALFIFTKNIIEGKPIELFNNGNMVRDFTYVEDIVEGINRVLMNPPVANAEWKMSTGDTSSSSAAYKVYNIGNNSPVRLLDYVTAIENAIGKKAIIELRPMQPGDVPAACSDVTDLMHDTGYRPNTPVEEGVRRFVEWYKEYYKIS